MQIQRFVVGPILTNFYLATDEESLSALAVDPGFWRSDGESVLRMASSQGLRIELIVNTHGHLDHVSGNRFLKKATGSQLAVHESDVEIVEKPWVFFEEYQEKGLVPPPCFNCGASHALEFDARLNEGVVALRCIKCGAEYEVPGSGVDNVLHGGDTVKLGSMSFSVIHTPGHSPGSICLHSRDEGILLSGDTLFKGRVGSLDQLHESSDDRRRSVKRLMELPDDTLVYPGHGDETTIGNERLTNPFVKSI